MAAGWICRLKELAADGYNFLQKERGKSVCCEFSSRRMSGELVKESVKVEESFCVPLLLILL